MKKYRHLLESLPSKTVVFAFGRFNPPTAGHELLIEFTKKLARQRRADYRIFVSRSQDSKKNPLSLERKLHYLNLMFPNTNFEGAGDKTRTFIEAAKQLNAKYSNIIMIAGSDRVPSYSELLPKYNGVEYNFNSIEVMSAGERDPDSDDLTGMSASKLRSFASKGDFHSFKQGMPSHMRDIDIRRLMNDVREGMGLDPIKEQIKINKDHLRESYFRGDIFNVGDQVMSKNNACEIIKRGTNHLLLKDSNGSIHSAWITEVTPL